MPENNLNNKPKSNSIGSALDETKLFITENLTARKTELDKIVDELEQRLSAILKPNVSVEEKKLPAPIGVVKNLENSLLYNMTLDIDNAARSACDGFENIRNKISVLISRLHL